MGAESDPRTTIALAAFVLSVGHILFATLRWWQGKQRGRFMERTGNKLSRSIDDLRESYRSVRKVLATMAIRSIGHRDWKDASETAVIAIDGLNAATLDFIDTGKAQHFSTVHRSEKIAEIFDRVTDLGNEINKLNGNAKRVAESQLTSIGDELLSAEELGLAILEDEAKSVTWF